MRSVLWFPIYSEFAADEPRWWCVAAAHSYVGVTAHFVSPEFKLQALCLGVLPDNDSHTGDQVASDLVEVLESVQFAGRVRSITTDNGANFKKAVHLFLERTQGGDGYLHHHVACYAHTLQLAVEDSVKACPPIRDALIQMKGLASLLKTSPQYQRRVEKLALEQGLGTTKVSCYVETRWNSWLKVVTSVLLLKEPLLKLRAEEDAIFQERLAKYNRQVAGGPRGRGRPMKVPEPPKLLQLLPERPSASWLLLEQMEMLLKEPAAVTTVAEGELYPSLSVSTVLLRRLERVVLAAPVLGTESVQGIASASDDIPAEMAPVSELRRTLQSALVRRFTPLNDAALVAVCVDPRQRWRLDCAGSAPSGATAVFDAAERDRAYQVLQQCVLEELRRSRTVECREAAISSSVAEVRAENARQHKRGHDGGVLPPMHHMQSLDDDYQLYQRMDGREQETLEEAAQNIVLQWRSGRVKVDMSGDVLQYWQERASSDRELAAVALRYSSIPATSAPSERIFSSAKIVSSGRRSRTSASRVQSLIRLRQNRRLQNSLQSLQQPPSV